MAGEYRFDGKETIDLTGGSARKGSSGCSYVLERSGESAVSVRCKDGSVIDLVNSPLEERVIPKYVPSSRRPQKVGEDDDVKQPIIGRFGCLFFGSLLALGLASVFGSNCGAYDCSFSKYIEACRRNGSIEVTAMIEATGKPLFNYALDGILSVVSPSVKIVPDAEVDGSYEEGMGMESR